MYFETNLLQTGYGGTNLAVNKPSWQTDAYQNNPTSYGAGVANDGNTNSLMHSDASSGPWWWYVDLESQKNIGNVRIYNRASCCREYAYRVALTIFLKSCY